MPQTSSAVASWYGKDFHGRPTSSGETFDMYAKTCAHREYPFGTRLQVTNIANSRVSECIVNDRGPFVSGRDIDLSYEVAKEIELIGPGTGKVLLIVQGRDNSYIKKPKVDKGVRKGPFAIQLGSFTDGVNAVRLRTALELEFNNVDISQAEVKGVIYYRVRIGNYNDLKKAFSIAEKLGQEGYQPVVLKAEEAQ